MSMFEGLAGDLLGSLIPGIESGHPALAPIIQLIQSQPGGIAGIARKFEQGGLGEICQSWIGSGPNQPVSAQQVQSVLGDGMVQQLAQQMGVSPETAGGHLADLLPGVVNHLTPNGAISEPTDLLSMGEGILKKLAAAE